MGKAVKKVVGTVGKLFGIDPSGQADAIREAAEAQAAATREAAEKQAAAARDAAAAQDAMVRQQAASAAAAQEASVNQNTLAAQLAAQAQERPQEKTAPEFNVTPDTDTENTRRRYMSSQSDVPLGGSAGGVGIRLK